jgi:hypothetical protein
VVVIGGGPGGEDGARDLVGYGLKVAQIFLGAVHLCGGRCDWLPDDGLRRDDPGAGGQCDPSASHPDQALR